jgi:hypothetical protein
MPTGTGIQEGKQRQREQQLKDDGNGSGNSNSSGKVTLTGMFCETGSILRLVISFQTSLVLGIEF